MPPRKETPAELLSRTLLAAEDDLQPGFTTDGFLIELGLGTNVSDKRTLLDRLTNGRPTLRNRAKLGGTIRDVERLLTAVNERTANRAQEAIAETLGAVLTAHVAREQELCQVGRQIVACCQRPDIIPNEITTLVDYLPPAPPQSRFMQNYLPR